MAIFDDDKFLLLEPAIPNDANKSYRLNIGSKIIFLGLRGGVGDRGVTEIILSQTLKQRPSSFFSILC